MNIENGIFYIILCYEATSFGPYLYSSTFLHHTFFSIVHETLRRRVVLLWRFLLYLSFGDVHLEFRNDILQEYVSWKIRSIKHSISRRPGVHSGFTTWALLLHVQLKDSVSLLHAIFRRIGGNTKVLKKILLGNLCAVFRSVGSLFVELNWPL